MAMFEPLISAKAILLFARGVVIEVVVGALGVVFRFHDVNIFCQLIINIFVKGRVIIVRLWYSLVVMN